MVLFFLLGGHRGPANLAGVRALLHWSRCFRRVYRRPPAIAWQLLLSVAIHFCTIGAVAILGGGVGLDLPLSAYLALVPPVILAMLLPISLAGWGIRESAMIGLFVQVGADRHRVLAMSLLYALVCLGTALPGLAVFLLEGAPAGRPAAGRRRDAP